MSEPTRCAVCGEELSPGLVAQLYGHRVGRNCRNALALRREVAWLLDYGVLVTVVTFATAAVDVVVRSDGEPRAPGDTRLGSFVIIGSILALLLKDSVRGVSPGKLLLGLRVVDQDTGAPIGPRQSLRRNLILLVPFMPLALAFMMRGGPRLGDGWANTRVIVRKWAGAPAFGGEPDVSTGWDLSSSEGWR